MMLAAVVLAVGSASCEREEESATGGSASGRRYTLMVGANNADWGTATGSGTYADGSRVDIEAVPALGYYFIRWSDGAIFNPRTITVSGDMTLYALFSATSNDPNPYNPADDHGNNQGGSSGDNQGGQNNGDDNGGNSGDTTGDWVDLGLPSGLLWATHNVGATNPEDYGDYFAWGETTTKSVYNWETYAYCSGDYKRLTKYCNSSSYGNNGFTDNLTVLQSGDDAATANWGNGARTPTDNEWTELISNCAGAWVTQNGVSGYRFTGRNGNTLFLPAAGRRWGDELDDAGSYGDYWSSSLYTGYPILAWRFHFSSDGARVVGDYRLGGFSVRPVRSAR